MKWHFATLYYEVTKNVYLVIFKVATLCLDSNSAHSGHSFNPFLGCVLGCFLYHIKQVHVCWTLDDCFSSIQFS